MDHHDLSIGARRAADAESRMEMTPMTEVESSVVSGSHMHPPAIGTAAATPASDHSGTAPIQPTRLTSYESADTAVSSSSLSSSSALPSTSGVPSYEDEKSQHPTYPTTYRGDIRDLRGNGKEEVHEKRSPSESSDYASVSLKEDHHHHTGHDHDPEAGVPLDSEGRENSPIPEVAAVVSNTDDPTMPYITFRFWLMGLVSILSLSFVNQ
ncbi:hypothetical protein BGW38_009531, partial [Lunasporangiospora selenospora]